MPDLRIEDELLSMYIAVTAKKISSAIVGDVAKIAFCARLAKNLYRDLLVREGMNWRTWWSGRIMSLGGWRR